MVFIGTSQVNDRLNGQIMNPAIQITSEPVRGAVIINKVTRKILLMGILLMGNAKHVAHFPLSIKQLTRIPPNGG
jgi:hypothetical protein